MKTTFDRTIRTLIVGSSKLVFAFFLSMQFAAAVSAAPVNLAWDANTEAYVQGYNVYRSMQDGVFTSAPINGSTPLTSTSFNDTTALSSETYYYVIKAVSSDGSESVASNQIQAQASSQTSNSAPAVNAGTNQTITLPSQTTLTATATDDGLPNGTLTYQWSLVSGSGVTFANPASASTSVSFAAAGSYTFKVTGSDGELSASDTMVVTVNGDASNAAPAVNAGVNQTITFPSNATLTATASDDGLPNGALTYQWSVVSGTGVTFANATSASTSVSFAAAGSYLLKATASDGSLSSSDTMVVTVDADSSSVSITSPAEGSAISAASVTVSAATSNSVGVQFELNGVKLGVEDTTAPFSISWNTKNKANGTYTLQAVARDAAGTLTTSAPVSVKLTRKAGR